MDAKSYYAKISNNSDARPLFSQAWWLDIVCGKNSWDVCGIKQNEEYVALMPYYITRKLTFSCIRQPILTPIISPWFKTSPFDMDIFLKLINNLPKVDDYLQHLPYCDSTLTSLKEHGYSVSERITYVIENQDPDKVLKGMKGNTRRLVQKAQKILTTRDDCGLKVFYDLLSKTFTRKKMQVPLTFSKLKRLDEACEKNGCRKILFSEDSYGNIHSAMYLVWDQSKYYYLLGGIDPDYKKSGGQSLLIWEAIKESISREKVFDFEGSMVPSIASFFRSFGASPYRYTQVRKENSKLIKIYRQLKNKIFSQISGLSLRKLGD